jgi:hypothetical protein
MPRGMGLPAAVVRLGPVTGRSSKKLVVFAREFAGGATVLCTFDSTCSRDKKGG